MAQRPKLVQSSRTGDPSANIERAFDDYAADSLERMDMAMRPAVAFHIETIRQALAHINDLRDRMAAMPSIDPPPSAAA